MQEAYLAELNDGPLSAHVRWVEPFAIGGVAGGGYSGEHAFDIGDAYAGKWSSREIEGGIAYWRLDNVVYPYVTIATDIRTGEELWRTSSTGISGINFGQTVVTDEGIDSYLVDTVSDPNAGSVYIMYDAWTLQWAYNITNMLGGSMEFGEKGEIIIYSINLGAGTMSYWNQLWMLEQPGVMETLARERSVNATEIGWTDEWSIPDDLPGSVREVRFGDRVVGTYEVGSTMTTTMWAFSLEPGKEGTLLYETEATYELADYTGNLGSSLSTSISARLLGDTPEESAHLHYIGSGDWKYWAYSYATGEELWKSTDFEETKDGELYLNQYDRDTFSGSWETGTNGWLYTCGCAGVVYAYHATKGLAWAYHANDPYSEILWANDWWGDTMFAANGKIYVGHEEHSPIDPLPRGAPFYCLNATTGEVIWRVDGMYRQTHWGGKGILGSGVILTQDTYDQRTYCVGKGPTAITVAVSDVNVPFGSATMIQGTVMDISPGCSDVKVQLRFPDGVPAVSEESMSEWMLYVYKQFARPADAVGVDVSVTVFDSAGAVVDSATVTSDVDGDFMYKFVAEDAGEYSVEASFAGSNSYYGSFALSSPFVVEEAPEPVVEPTPEPESVAELYFVPAVAGIIVVLVAIGVVLVLLLRRR